MAKAPNTRAGGEMTLHACVCSWRGVETRTFWTKPVRLPFAGVKLLTFMLFLCSLKLLRRPFFFFFLETGNLRALILGGEKDLNTLIYLSIQRTSPSVASTSQEKVAFCACSLTMSMSAFTECDNPFSTESDALEQCLKKYVCVLTSLCVCV